MKAKGLWSLVALCVVSALILGGCQPKTVIVRETARATAIPEREKVVKQTVEVREVTKEVMKEVTRAVEQEVIRPLPTPAAGSTAVPVVPVYGGQTLPNDQAFDSMFFEHYGVNPFIDTEDDHLSTFAMDVDTASYTVARRYIKEGQLPPQDAIHVEELVNYFDQLYADPQDSSLD